jgi:hypothetical protein
MQTLALSLQPNQLFEDALSQTRIAVAIVVSPLRLGDQGVELVEGKLFSFVFIVGPTFPPTHDIALHQFVNRPEYGQG